MFISKEKLADIERAISFFERERENLQKQIWELQKQSHCFVEERGISHGIRECVEAIYNKLGLRPTYKAPGPTVIARKQ